MESTRQQKYARLIQKEFGDIFQRDTKHFFGSAFITVTLVKMSPDLGFARVYLSIFMAKDKAELLENINEKKGQLRKLLGQKIGRQVRTIPEITFFADDIEDQAQKMDNLIDSLHIPPADETGTED